MRVGLIARCDMTRGLAIQTHEFFRNMRPDATLVVNSELISSWPQTPSAYPAYPESRHITYDPNTYAFVEWDQVASFLLSVDIVYSAETFYDRLFIARARQAGVKTVLHANFEFCDLKGFQDETNRPDAIWFPSQWMRERWPQGSKYVPFPVARDRCAYRHRDYPARKFLHVVGAPTVLDRNGTKIFTNAVSLVGEGGCEFTVTALTSQHQHRRINNPPPHENYWDIYADHDVLVMPRRFGGQCLPMNEALSCGLPVIMSNCPPQSFFLHPLMMAEGTWRGSASMKPGHVELFNTSTRALARAMNRLSRDGELMGELSSWANEWANMHSWETWEPIYRKEFEDICNGEAM